MLKKKIGYSKINLLYLLFLQRDIEIRQLRQTLNSNKSSIFNICFTGKNVSTYWAYPMYINTRFELIKKENEQNKFTLHVIL